MACRPGFVFAAVLAMAGAARAAEADHQVIPLYSGAAPGSEDWTQTEHAQNLKDPRFTPPNDDILVWNVTHPTLTVFRPASGKANGAAVIVAPGGGFRVLSYTNEGVRVAQNLADNGVTAFVLKYRLNRMPDDADQILAGMGKILADAAKSGVASASGAPAITLGPVEQMGISDGERAVGLVRARAAEFGVDPKRIGIIGFSAGGVVSGETAVKAAPSERPDFVGIIYAFVPDEIPSGAPPAFMAAAADDPLSRGMPDLFRRWLTANSSAELHIYAKGQHGFGTAKQGLPVDHWLDAFHAWLAQQGFVPRGGA